MNPTPVSFRFKAIVAIHALKSADRGLAVGLQRLCNGSAQQVKTSLWGNGGPV